MSDREKLIEILRVPIYPHLDADPAEVVADYLLDNGVTVRERGRWIQDTPFACVCSVCNHERYGLANDSGENFCPNCGADMRPKGEGEEDG